MQDETKIKSAMELLELEEGVEITSQILTKAYKAAASKWHPDRNQSKEKLAHETFIKVNEAYELLERLVKVNGGSFKFLPAEKSILGRAPESFESEIKKDPEAVIFPNVRASRMAAILEIVFAAATGLVIGYFLWRHLRYDLKLSAIRYPWLLPVTLGVPTAVLTIWRFKSVYKKLLKRWEISRRFITSELFIGVPVIDTCDMTKVKDARMFNFGPVSNIKIMTTDHSSPIISMEFIPTKTAKEIVAFVRAHATNTYVEWRTSRRSR